MPVQMISLESGGRTIALRVRVAADTRERQAGGFQCATPQEIERNLILFDFGREITTQFHMQNVPAALDIAFIKGDGRIFSILRMEPSPTALYGPHGRLPLRAGGAQGFLREPGHPPGRGAARAPARHPLTRARPAHSHGSRHKGRLRAALRA